MSLTSQLSGSLIGSNWYNLCKIQSMMSHFSAIEKPLPVYCCFLFTLFKKQVQRKEITQIANDHLNPLLIPQLSNILGVNACDITVHSKVHLRKHIIITIIIKLPHLNIIDQVFLVLTAESICITEAVTVLAVYMSLCVYE